MILYLDTSAAVKLFIEEAFSVAEATGGLGMTVG